MKKFVLIATIFFTLITVEVLAVNQELVCKVGTGYAHDLDNAGLDLSVFYTFEFDPYFAAGIEGTFFWVPWDKKVGEKTGVPVSVDVVASSNVFALPIMFNGQVRLPFLVKKIYVEPNVTFGIGYTPVVLNYDRPAYEDADTTLPVQAKEVTRFFHGFSWQLLLGASFKPSVKSTIRFVGDIGYRGINARHGSEKLKMSGILFRIGVLFKL